MILLTYFLVSSVDIQCRYLDVGPSFPPKVCSVWGAAAGALPSPSQQTRGSSGRYPEPSVRQFSDTAGGGGGGADIRQTSGEGSLGALTPSNSYTAPPGTGQIGGIGTPAPGTCGQCATQEHRNTSEPHSSLELERKVREDFTITEKASTRAFYP